MKRTTVRLSAILVLGILLAPVAVDAQRPPKVPRIGVMLSGSSKFSPVYDALVQGLRDLGYVEGKNIVIESRWAEGRYDRIPGFATELVGLKVDLIVAVSSADVVAARNATKTIPIVMVYILDPVRQGFVASFARPGGNITGLSATAGAEIFGKQLELLKEVIPEVTRVAVLYNPANPYSPLALREIEVVARALVVRLQLVEARSSDELDSALASISRERAGGLLVLVDGLLVAHRKRILDFATANGLPAMYGLRLYAEAGGLMVYGASLTDNARRAAAYVDKILKGAKPADLPVEQPTKFELVVNLKTAKALGLTIPQTILIRADQLIQ